MVKIYTMTHRRFHKPDDEIYLPLHVGHAAAEDLGYPGDDRGENISALNCYYGELTGLYWVWKHESEADIVGICHYRRFFLNDAGQVMKAQEYESLLSDCDVLLPKFIVNECSNWDCYVRAHNERDLRAIADAVQKLYPEDYEAFCAVMRENVSCYGNLMAASLDKYKEYCAWLFPIFEETGERIDVSGYDAYHKRVYGFYSEILLYVWVTARGLKYRECPVGLTAEKAETTEFKRTVHDYILQRDIARAKQYFYEQLKKRPDLRAPISDISGEIAIIEKLLYIMHEEAACPEPGLLDFSSELALLIEHYKNSHRLISALGDRALVEGKMYFDSVPLSGTAFRIIKEDVDKTLCLYDYLNEENPEKKVSVLVLAQGQDEPAANCIGNLLHQTLGDMEILFAYADISDNMRGLLAECQLQYPETVRVISAQEGRELPRIHGEYLLVTRLQDLPGTDICEKLYTKAVSGHLKLVRGTAVGATEGSVSAPDYCGVLMDGSVWRERQFAADLWEAVFGQTKPLPKFPEEALPVQKIADIVYQYN